MVLNGKDIAGTLSKAVLAETPFFEEAFAKSARDSCG
jgi:hypothetical protein